MKTIDISGMGGGYENCCQQLFKNGLDFLEANPGLKYDFKQYESVTGICIAESENAKKLEAAIVKDFEDATGAMVHTVISHLLWINKNGKEKFFAEAEKQGHNVFEWDGSAESCPQTEISKKMEAN